MAPVPKTGVGNDIGVRPPGLPPASEVEWSSFIDREGMYDIRALRRFPGPPAYVAISRWKISELESKSPIIMEWLAGSLLRAQRELDALENVVAPLVPLGVAPPWRGVIKI